MLLANEERRQESKLEVRKSFGRMVYVGTPGYSHVRLVQYRPPSTL